MLQPLLELGNVRRMSDDELRTAAQRILEGRSTRISQQPNDGYATPGVSVERVVPSPQD
jgi:hypothetical protein